MKQDRDYYNLKQHRSMLNGLPAILASAVTIATILISLSSDAQPEPNTPLSAQASFKLFMDAHGKSYKQEEYAFRFSVYQESVQRVRQHNQEAQQGQHTYFTAINEYSDMPWWEFEAKYLQSAIGIQASQPNYACAGPQPLVRDMPAEFDWESHGAITAVRKVSGCGSAAYAIAVAETIESGRFITTGKLTQTSPQQILDCSSAQGNKGCTSGNFLNSIEYVLKSGITGESKYPYTDKNGTGCAYHISQKEWEILGCTKVNSQNETIMRAALVRQPLAASVNATQKFKEYSSGVFDVTGPLQGCKTGANHWVTVVGFGTDSSSKKKFWKLKNSLGSSWGMKGFMNIVRTGDGEGLCGIQNQVYYPLD